jgi:glycosyltransferase involved in cell wall biosynthesis
VTPSSIATDLLYVGRLVDHKNIDLLLDALTQLKLHGASPKTVIAGDGPERLRLETVAQTRGLDNVLFLGPVETDRSIYAIMKSAHVFVLPSMREGFGLAALEAAAAGLPIVTVDSRHNAALELVVGRTIGLVSPPTSIEFAAVLRRMIEDQALYTQLRDNALAVAREFDLPRVAFLAEGEYLSILNSKSAGEILLTPTG